MSDPRPTASNEYDNEICGCEECQACLRREIRSLEKGRAADRAASDAREDRLREALEEVRKMALRPMKSQDAGSVVDAYRVEDVCNEALEAIPPRSDR
jgi:hypothetical protein